MLLLLNGNLARLLLHNKIEMNGGLDKEAVYV
jgi:hypothetical protein